MGFAVIVCVPLEIYTYMYIVLFACSAVLLLLHTSCNAIFLTVGELHGHGLAALAYESLFCMIFCQIDENLHQQKISCYTVQEPDTLIDTKQEAISYRSICHVAS